MNPILDDFCIFDGVGQAIPNKSPFRKGGIGFCRGETWIDRSSGIYPAKLALIVLQEKGEFNDNDWVCYCFHYSRKQIEKDYAVVFDRPAGRQMNYRCLR
jgi:hypothetical protein